MRCIKLLMAMILVIGCDRQQADNSPVAGVDRPESAAKTNVTAVTNPDPIASGNVAVAQGNSGSTSPCMMQGADQLAVKPMRALGTEPFWSARVEGRCVTYATPEDQQGTRIWTRYSAEADGGAWTGQLGGKKFELRIRSEPGCSDGMSDKRYPQAAELLVQGEQRRGCAELL